MTRDRGLKRLVRARMAETGSSYGAARREIVTWEHRRPTIEEVPEEARQTLAALRAAIDDAMPGLVVGWYVVGSAALGDHRPGTSDVDFVALLDRAPDDAELEAVREVHRTIGGRPLDGSYATVEQLRTGNPAELLAHDRAVRRRDPYGAHAVARHELVSVGVTLAGPPVSSLDVRDEADELRSWVRDNVEAYWAPWAGGAMGWNRVGLWALLPSGVEWGALGISRMLFTAVTGEVTSKSGAGAWALRHVDRAHHDVLEDALRIRDGGFVNPVGALDRRARLIAYMGDAIRQIRSTAMPR